MPVRIYNKSKDTQFKQYYQLLNIIFNNTMEKLNKKISYEVNVILVKSKYIHNINKNYRNIDKPTDVITFAYKDEQYEFDFDNLDEELGDIYINVDYVLSQSKEYNHSIKREFCFLFIHGLLHTLGYDHNTKEEEKIMFDLQDEILNPLVERK